MFKSNKGSNKDTCDLHRSLNPSQPQYLKNKQTKRVRKKDKLRNEKKNFLQIINLSRVNIQNI